MSVSVVDRGLDYAAGRVQAGLSWLLDVRRASYGVSVVRIVLGLGVVAFLLANLRDRHYLWGDAARWYDGLDDNGGFGFPFTLFLGGGSPTQVTLTYGLVLVVAVLVVLGWRTRVLTPVLLLLWTSLIEANPLYGDQSDNISRILLLYFCFADLSGRWSLDARRRRHQVERYGAPRPLGRLGSAAANANLSQAGTLLHNLAVVAAGAQICLIYVASALYKVQGEPWQNGTAVFYPLNVDQYRPWPGLADLLVSNAFMVTLVTYFSVFIQLFFPLMLLRRTTRVLALLGVTAMHLGIAVVMGLPFFSLFIMAGDAIFVRDSTFVSVIAWWRRRRGEPPGRVTGPPAQRTGSDQPSERLPEHDPGHAPERAPSVPVGSITDDAPRPTASESIEEGQRRP